MFIYSLRSFSQPQYRPTFIIWTCFALQTVAFFLICPCAAFAGPPFCISAMTEQHQFIHFCGTDISPEPALLSADDNCLETWCPLTDKPIAFLTQHRSTHTEPLIRAKRMHTWSSWQRDAVLQQLGSAAADWRNTVRRHNGAKETEWCWRDGQGEESESREERQR